MDSQNGREESESMSGDRRRFLRSVSAVGIAGVVAGCLGGDGDDGTATPTPTPTSAGGEFTVRSIDPAEGSVTRPNTIEISATIENEGSGEVTQTVELRVDGDVVDSTEVTLAGGANQEVSLTLDSTNVDPGEYEHTVATDDSEQSGTLTVEPLLDSEDPENPFAFEGDDPLELSFGPSTISGTLTNPYLVSLSDVQVDLSIPEGWEITAEENTSLDTLESSADVSWDLEIPAPEQEEFELTATISYTAAGEEAEVESTITATVNSPLSIPFGMDCGGAHTSETPEIDGLPYQPASEVSDGLSLSVQPFDTTLYQGRTLTDEETWWPGAVSPTPTPEEFPGALNDARPLAAQEGLGSAPDIANTPYDSLYWTEHYGEELTYEFTVPNGSYDVTVHLAEVWWASEGQRVFDVTVQGEALVEGLDLYAQHGPDTAVQEIATDVTVENSTLTVATSAEQGTPKIAAIEIREAGNAPAFDGSGEAFEPTPATYDTVYNFETDPNEDDAWTVEQDDFGQRDLSYGSYTSVGIESDGTDGALLASTTISEEGTQISSLSFFTRETSNSTGNGIRLINSDGNPELGVALDNPQWFTTDGGDPESNDGPVSPAPVTKLWDPQDSAVPPSESIPWNEFYQQWVYVEMDFDWDAGTYDLKIRNLEADVENPATVTLTTTRYMQEGTDVAQLHLSNYNIGLGQHWDADDGCYAWFDDIRVS